MGLYTRFILPRVVHLTCSSKPTTRQRMKLIPRAEGRVVEVGIGSGLNLPFYDPDRVQRIWGVDPSRELVSMAASAAADAPFEVEFVSTGAEAMPVESGSADTVVVTYSLCSIREPGPALREMARVLRRGGRLLFCEHCLAPDAGVRRWQNGLNPIWRRVGGGCHLNRDIPDLIRSSGFEILDVDSMYIPGWRPASFNVWGSATAR